jgi:hypothetical protein
MFRLFAKGMAESRRYVLTLQGLPNFDKATPLNVVIPAMAGSSVTVEVNIPLEFLSQSEMSVAPAVYASVPEMPMASMQQPLYTAPFPLGTPGKPNPPISSVLASPGQQLNISSQKLVSPGRQNSLTIPIVLSPSSSRGTIPGEAPPMIPMSPRIKPTPIPVASTLIIPSNANSVVATASSVGGLPGLVPEKKMSPGDAFRQNPTISAPKVPMTLAEVLTSPQMLAPLTVQKQTEEPVATMGTTCSMGPKSKDPSVPRQYNCPSSDEVAVPVNPSELLKGYAGGQ